MHALRHVILSPSGVEFAVALKLISSTPSTLVNVVTAKSNLLRVYGIREQPSPTSDHVESERDKRARVRKGTEAVEGEVEMDQSGEGWVNVGAVKSNANQETATTLRFHLLREHTLHGTVTGVDKVRTMASSDDKLDRLLISFKDAKIALLEWSDAIYDLVTVSIHTYERSPQMAVLDSHLFRAELRADSLSRCAALSLPKDSIAILPFYQTQAELDVMEQDQSLAREVPYSPSFVLDLVADVDSNLRNVIDFVFLPGYHNPTIAVLCQSEKTWAGRLKEYRDTGRLYIFTLDLLNHTYPIITAVDNLPYDCLSLLPCAQSIGGVVILTANSLIYVDQAARRVSLPVNAWSARVGDIPSLPLDKDLDLILEGSRLVFADEKTFFVIRKDGMIHSIEIISDGRTVSRLVLSPALAQTTIPTVTRQLGWGMLFVGSTVGPSVLLRAVRVEEEVVEGEAEDTSTALTAVVDTKNAMDIDDFDDDDLYGESKPVTKTAANGATPGAYPLRTRSVIHISLCDSLPAYGPIADMTFSLSKLGERYVPELVVATGGGHLGGFTLFQRDLPLRTKRKLHVLGGARGIWSIPVRQSHRVNGTSYEKTSGGLYAGENDTIVISTDANPSPGVSRIATRAAKTDLTIPTRIPGTTVSAGPFFQRTAILHVMTNAIRVLEPDGTERQIIKDMDGNMPRARIKACSICDPFVLILREDETIGLFIGETERGKIRRKDMSPMGEKSSRYLAGCFYTDTSNAFEMATTDGTVAASSNADNNITSTLQAAVTTGHNSQWLVLIRPQGVMEIWSLPKLTLVFSSVAIGTLEPVLSDSFDPPAPSPPQDPPRKLHDLDIEQILIAPLGESAPTPHLFVFMRCGHLAVYEVHSIPLSTSPSGGRSVSLQIVFTKVLTRTFELSKQEDAEKTVLAEQKRISRTFVPFVTSPTTSLNVNASHTLTGVFFTGDKPSWIIRTDKGGLKLFPSGHAVVHAFTACSLWESKAEFLVYSDEGPTLLEWIPDVELDTSLPKRSLPRSRPYSNIVFEPSASLIVAASTLPARFASYDEDNNMLWEPDGTGVSFPQCDCSTLELIFPDSWITMDGYEFAPNEYVNALECVTLETLSTESGNRDFIAVGTSIDRGEDLAVKGATYIFEVVEVVPDPSFNTQRWYKLKLRVRDDSKGPVTALCGINGYLVSSMGQKIFVRAFDLDERLVGVAFLDVGVYVTSLRVLKNLLLIGDAVKSVWLVAFQEDPYKLVILAKDIRRTYATNVDFFFTNGELSIVLNDEEGVLRMLTYDPSDPDSRGGQHLMCFTEFHCHKECRASRTIARRTKEDNEIPQAKLIAGFTDGSLSALTPVDEGAFKRLHLLQGQLLRNVQHVAGLNPKAYRIVRNDTVSKPMSRGVLDGQLLETFEELGIQGQQEMTRQIGTERIAVLRDWSLHVGPW
ncbi:CPSF A subunit region-domain-containing protein [Butyriboletus roseoflavus]|nr:CPSF A subunit region-domain-containing protein [Butyriboletus roseoflavus]